MGRSLVVAEAQGLEKVHIHDGRTGGHDGVHHVVADEIHVDLHTPCGGGAAGNGEKYGALPVLQHSVVDGGGFAQVPGGKGHLLHGLHKVRRVVRGDVDMVHRLL